MPFTSEPRGNTFCLVVGEGVNRASFWGEQGSAAAADAAGTTARVFSSSIASSEAGRSNLRPSDG